MILKYKQGESWAYLEGTYVKWTRINMQDELEKIFEGEEDESECVRIAHKELMKEIKEKLQTDTKNISFKTNYPILSKRTLCAMIIYDKDRESDFLVVLDDTAFLLNDTGKTIERLL